MKLPVTNGFYTQVKIHSSTSTTDVILTQEFQKHLFHVSQKNGLLDYVKHNKWEIFKKWTNIEYHMQKDEDVSHKYVKKIVILSNFLHWNFRVHT